MKFVIVSGSHRSNSQSLKVAQYVAKQIESSDHSQTLVDLSLNKLPLWDDSMWSSDADQYGKWKTIWDPIAQQLKEADGLVIISPEYAGMASAAIKNFFLFVSGSLIAHKPGLIISVSSGGNGAYPVAELRSFSSKNSRLVYIPDHVIVRNVESVLNDENSNSWIQSKISYSLDMLFEYAKALKAIRDTGKINLKDHPNGM